MRRKVSRGGSGGGESDLQADVIPRIIILFIRSQFQVKLGNSSFQVVLAMSVPGTMIIHDGDSSHSDSNCFPTSSH